MPAVKGRDTHCVRAPQSGSPPLAGHHQSRIPPDTHPPVVASGCLRQQALCTPLVGGLMRASRSAPATGVTIHVKVSQVALGARFKGNGVRHKCHDGLKAPVSASPQPAIVLAPCVGVESLPALPPPVARPIADARPFAQIRLSEELRIHHPPNAPSPARPAPAFSSPWPISCSRTYQHSQRLHPGLPKQPSAARKIWPQPQFHAIFHTTSSQYTPGN